jgi:hypothetical protein
MGKKREVVDGLLGLVDDDFSLVKQQQQYNNTYLARQTNEKKNK